MFIKYWGTAAAEGVPAVFCNCDACRTAREQKGRHIRMRSQCLLDGKLMIDFGPDTYSNSIKYDYELFKLEHLIITHSHRDHFYAHEFGNRTEVFAKGISNKLNIYGAKHVCDEIYQKVQKYSDAKNRLNITEINAYNKFNAGEYTITPLPATHSTVEPFVYLIETEKTTLLYFHDSGYPTDEVLDYLEGNRVKIDVVSYDCTYGVRDILIDGHKSHGHMGLLDNVRLRDIFIKRNLFYDDTVNIANHFSHNGKDVSYDIFKSTAEKYGFLTSFDGMEIDI